MSDPQGDLKRTLGFWALTIYGVGDILGAGIYALVGKIAGVAGMWSWLSFLVAMGVASLTALSYAELGSRFPRSGGASYFCQTAFGRPEPALLIGWLVLCSGLFSMAAGSHAFAGYLVGFLSLPEAWTTIVTVGAILVFLIMLAGINFIGMHLSSAANIFCTTLEVSGLLIVLALGGIFLFNGDAPVQAAANAAAAAAGVPWSLVLTGGALSFFAFVGFEDLVNVAEEVKQPERNLPAAILSALGIAGVIYMAVVMTAIHVVPPADLAKVNGPLLLVVERAAPWFPLVVFAGIAMFAVSNTALLNYIMGSRLLYGMSRQGLLPRWVGTVHAVRRTPVVAIGIVFVIALTLAMIGTLRSLAAGTSFLLLGVFCVVHVALLTVKWRERQTPDVARQPAFRIPAFIPALGALSALGLMANTDRKALLSAVAIATIGLVIIAVHWIATRRRGEPSQIDVRALEAEPDEPLASPGGGQESR